MENTVIKCSGIGVIAMAVFLGFLLCFGLVMKSRSKSGGDFWVGGRSVGPIPTAISFCAACFSATAVVGGPAMFAQYGAGYQGFEAVENRFGICFLIIVMGAWLSLFTRRILLISTGSFLMGLSFGTYAMFYSTVPADILKGEYPGAYAAPISLILGVGNICSAVIY